MNHKLFSTPRVLFAAFAFVFAAAFPAAAPAAGPPAGGFLYVVQYGDTLESIAARFGVSVQSIIAANELAARAPYVGRSLYMPTGYAPYAAGNYTARPFAGYAVYIVQSGDTLAGIAQRYGVSLYAMMQSNHLYNPNFIYAGMRLLVPRTNYAPRAYANTYVVRFGDTLSGIALRFGTSVYALMVANNIPNPNLIFAGMRLAIPGAASKAYLPASGYPMPPAYAYPTPSQAPGATPTPPATMPSGGATVAVSMQNIAFNPASLTVHVGTTVVWTNNESDGIQHTVTSGAPGAPSGVFDSGTLNPGQSFRFTFNSTGTFAYYCRIHGAHMTGSVTVIP
jgi:LysM repeat protein